MTAEPATQLEAEKLAVDAVQKYINACHVSRHESREQIGNYLMKLCSVAGAFMARVGGSEDAALRLHGTAEYILKTQPISPGKMETVQ
jgi:hypothetical protein